MLHYRHHFTLLFSNSKIVDIYGKYISQYKINFCKLLLHQFPNDCAHRNQLLGFFKKVSQNSLALLSLIPYSPVTPVSLFCTHCTNVCARGCVCVCVFASKACESVSISPWQHSSKTEPVRGLCLTSLFNQTQTHTSGQPGPRYLPLPPCARCTHPVLSLLFLLCLLFLLLLPSSSAPLCITLSPGSSSFPTSCVLLLVPLTPPPPSYPASLSPRDVTFCTDSGAAASKLGQNWLKMCTHLVWCP